MEVLEHNSAKKSTSQRGWNITHIIRKGDATGLYGGDCDLKSCTALEIGFCIALGKPYRGKRVTQGAVFYIYGGGSRNKRRKWIKKLRDKYSIPDRLTIPLFMSDGFKCLDITDQATIIGCSVAQTLELYDALRL